MPGKDFYFILKICSHMAVQKLKKKKPSPRGTLHLGGGPRAILATSFFFFYIGDFYFLVFKSVVRKVVEFYKSTRLV